MEPGELVWERFGHNALWILDPARGTSIAYNWGLFDFDQPYFIPRFLSGDTRYWMEGFDSQRMIDAYLADGRSVTVQELRLTAAQRVALREYLEWNALPQNRFYRYDYFRDNCSTRVRDAIDRALGSRLRPALSARATAETYRSMTLSRVSDEEALAAGMALVLGEPADRPLSAWEASFIPMRFRDEIRTIMVPDDSGHSVPLVSGESYFRAPRELVVAQAGLPPSWPLVVAGALIALVFLLVARAATHGSRIASRAFVVLASAWGILAGVLGVVLVGAWAATRHFAMYQNENLFQFNPLAFAILPALWRRGHRGGARNWPRVSLVIAGLSVLGLLLQLLPTFDQVNGAIIGFALPVHLALALGAAQLRPRAPSSVTPGTRH